MVEVLLLLLLLVEVVEVGTAMAAAGSSASTAARVRVFVAPLTCGIVMLVRSQLVFWWLQGLGVEMDDKK